MGWTGDLLTGVAEHLAAAGVGTWQAIGAYPDGAHVPIFRSQVPGAPDRIIVLTAYAVDDDPALTDVVQGVQVRTRGASGAPTADVDEVADTVYEELHGLHDTVLHGVPVVLARRATSVYLGADGNRRHERSDNYMLNAIRPSTHRRD